jgi:hypothetical protein
MFRTALFATMRNVPRTNRDLGAPRYAETSSSARAALEIAGAFDADTVLVKRCTTEGEAVAEVERVLAELAQR